MSINRFLTIIITSSLYPTRFDRSGMFLGVPTQFLIRLETLYILKAAMVAYDVLLMPSHGGMVMQPSTSSSFKFMSSVYTLMPRKWASPEFVRQFATTAICSFYGAKFHDRNFSSVTAFAF